MLSFEGEQCRRTGVISLLRGNLYTRYPKSARILPVQNFYSVARKLQNLPRNGSQHYDTCFFVVHLCYRKGFYFLIHSYKIQDGFSRSLNPWNIRYRGWSMLQCIFQLHLATGSTVAGAGWVRSSVHCGERTRVERDRWGSSSKIDSLRVSRSGLEREMKHRNHMKGDLCWQHEDAQQ